MQVDRAAIYTHLPRPLTPFVGRQTEIATITSRLEEHACRLLTVVGPGGIGKTRLAIEVAQRWQDEGNPVAFVDLQPLQSPDFLIPAVADALDPTIAGRGDPRQQLLHYLADKELLIVLDNFEHLLPAAEFLVAMLQAGTGIKLLVTSRAVLNLREEWLYAPEGLHYPAVDEAEPEELETYDAVRLFLSYARQVRPDFSAGEEVRDVSELCALVEGMPLAIELAAAWAGKLPVADMVHEIKEDLAFLSSPLRNVPEKHRSMQVVFRYSWDMLQPQEQAVFQGLSIFQGGFDREAACQVANASLSTLSALVDQSLLRAQGDGRYTTHELLRQWGAEQKALSEEEMRRTRDRHAAYYARFLGRRFGALTGEGQLEALAEVATELDNVRAAWRWAIEQRRYDDLEQGAMTLHTYYQYRGRFVEGAEAFRAAVAAVEEVPSSMERDRALALLYTCSGWLEMRVGDVQQARDLQEQALALYEKHRLLPMPGQGTDPRTALSLVATTGGDYEQALAYGREAWERAANRDDGVVDEKNQAFAGYGLTSAALAKGDYETALYYAHETLALTRATANRWLMAYITIQLGQINQALGNLRAAAEYYQTSYTIREALDDPEGMALALSHMGEVALAQGKYEKADTLYQRSRSLYHKLGDRGGLVRAFQGLALAASALGEAKMACRRFIQALQVAAEAAVDPITLSLLAHVGSFLLGVGREEHGTAALQVVALHPATDERTGQRVRQALGDKLGQRREGPAVPARLDSVIMTLLGELSALEEAPLLEEAEGVRFVVVEEQALVEPLSERELEVMAQIALGLKNREIAEELTIALSTVKSHIKSIYGKMGVSNRVQAVARARELGLVE